MKKAILKVFGVAALVAGMMCNVQVFESANSSDITLGALGNLAVAQSESGDFESKTGCRAVWENVKCSGKDGRLHTYAERI